MTSTLKKSFSTTSSILTQNVASRDVELDYVVHGDDTNGKSPVVVSHGMFGNKKNLRYLSNQINLSTGRRVVAYDAVNHGLSSHSKNMSFHDMSYDMMNLLDKLQIETAVLLGHSMGGKTVMTAALSYPERVEKLVVVDSAPEVSKSMGEVMVYLKAMLDIDMTKMTTRKMVEEELIPAVPSKSIRMFLMSNIEKSKDSFSWRINLEAIENNYHYIHSFPEISDHVRYNKPTLFVGGGRSTYITEAEYPRIYNYFPFAKIEHVPDAGHWVHSEKPEEFLEIVIPFIS